MTDDPRQVGTFSDQALDAVIKIGLVAILTIWCLEVLRPFAVVAVWAAIMAISIYPFCLRLAGWLGGRLWLSATLLTVVAVALLLGPVAGFAVILIADVQDILDALAAGRLVLPPAEEAVRDWPLVGPILHDFWSLAASNLTEAAAKVEPQVKALARTLLSGLLGAGVAILQFLLAFLIGGFLLTRAAMARRAAEALARKLTAARGTQLIEVMISTIRNVSRGVLGTAVIQSFFAGLGMVVAGIPGAGVWTAACLVLAIIQIGPGLVLLGTVIYMFSEASTLAAVLYTVWVIPVTLLDNVLKPILMGRGSQVPVLVIFLGVVGGTLSYGIIGVFVGPVILALGYRLFAVWVYEGEPAMADK